jgi:hypothetical protein
MLKCADVDVELASKKSEMKAKLHIQRHVSKAGGACICEPENSQRANDSLASCGVHMYRTASPNTSGLINECCDTFPADSERDVYALPLADCCQDQLVRLERDDIPSKHQRSVELEDGLRHLIKVTLHL